MCLSRLAYGRVEQSSAHSEEYPDIHHQTEAEDQTDVKQYTRIWCLCDTVVVLSRCDSVAVCRRSVGYTRSSKCKEQEHERAGELSSSGNQFIAPPVGHKALCFLRRPWRGAIAVRSALKS